MGTDGEKSDPPAVDKVVSTDSGKVVATDSGPTAPKDVGKIDLTLEDLVVVLINVTNTGAAEYPYSLFPRFQPESLFYEVEVPKGDVVIYPRAKSASAEVSLEFEGEPVVRGTSEDGKPFFNLGSPVNGKSRVEVMVSESGITRKYSILLATDEIGEPVDPDGPRLKSMVMSHETFYRSYFNVYVYDELQPAFHPDSSVYIYIWPGTRGTKLTLVPQSAQDSIEVSSSGVKLAPLEVRNDTLTFLVPLHFPMHFFPIVVLKVILKNRYDGKIRVYTISAPY